MFVRYLLIDEHSLGGPAVAALLTIAFHTTHLEGHHLLPVALRSKVVSDFFYYAATSPNNCCEEGSLEPGWKQANLRCAEKRLSVMSLCSGSSSTSQKLTAQLHSKYFPRRLHGYHALD